VAAVLAAALDESMTAVLRVSGLGTIDEPTGGFDDPAARAELLAVVAGEQERLLSLLEAHEAAQPELAAEDAARASFDRSRDGERVHRYQAQWGRALLQTLKAIAALQPALESDEPAEHATAAPERSHADEEKELSENDLHQDDTPRSRPGPAVAPRSEAAPEASRRPAEPHEPAVSTRAAAALMAFTPVSLAIRS
jgi:hypothetical protein